MRPRLKVRNLITYSDRVSLDRDLLIDCFHDPIMQYVLGGSLHKNNTIYFLLGLDHASGN